VAPLPGPLTFAGHLSDKRWSYLAAVTANPPLGPSSYGEPKQNGIMLQVGGELANAQANCLGRRSSARPEDGAA
jgi:hypothetical protein